MRWAILNSGRIPERHLFRDSGHGIDAGQPASAFSDHHSSPPRKLGQGTGLGLSVVSRASIQAVHAGAITVESKVGQGATFTAVAATRRKAESVEEAAPDTSVPRGSGELIAVVDDEDIVPHVRPEWRLKTGLSRQRLSTRPCRCLEALKRQPADFALRC